jgi:hypothetical protein
MRIDTILKASAALAASLVLLGCTSNSDAGNGSITGGSSSGGGISDTGGPANDGSTSTSVSQGGTKLSGGFICSQGAQQYGATTKVGSGGLVGGPLTTLLDTLGATTLTQLLNSVSSPNNVIDDSLDTYAGFTLTAGLFAGAIDSLDESVLLPTGTTVQSGKFAVFGVGFPNGLANLNALSSVKVSTFLNNTLQESNTLSQSDLVLLTKGVNGLATAFVGVATTKSYDTAQISLTPGLLTANVGQAMRVYELCVDGKLVTPP